jgi:ATP-dependent Clp protease ATP-binding subunit ClpA
MVIAILDSKPMVEFMDSINLQSSEITEKLRSFLSSNDKAPHSPEKIRERVEYDGFVLEPSTGVIQVIADTHAYVINNGRNVDELNSGDILRVVIENGYDCIFNTIMNRNPSTKKTILDAFNKQGTKKEETSSEEENAVTNLNELAIQGRIDPIIGREQDIHYISEILAKKKKNNVMLLGLAGSGKTALAEGLALGIVNKTVHPSLFDKTVYMIDVAAMLAGTKFRGDFEQRAQNIINKLSSDKNSIVFIDEIHTVMGAGSGTNGGLDLANMMKPYLARGELRCIGATTFDEYKAVVEKDKAMVRRFTNYAITEPNKKDMIAILNGLRESYSQFHSVTYTDESIELMYDLATKYIQNRANPDKTVDIFDSVGAYVKINNRNVVENDDVYRIVSKVSNVPVAAMVSEKEDDYSNLDVKIKKNLFGQDHIVDKVTEQIMMAKAGLVESNKTMASFLLVGTSGVGKTELARQVASNLNVPLLKYDMSEYQESHSVAKLIGAPPGYAGYDENSAGLVDDIERNPNCVLLIDEIEKAHPKVLDIFLQVMDDATLKSSQGKTVKFNNVVLLMTSNAGAREGNENPIGFNLQKDQQKKTVNEAIKKFFRPEFLNRLDGVETFNNLSMNDVMRIIDKEIAVVNDMLEPHGIILNISESAKSLIATEGYDPKMGARPIKRVIAEKIKKPLSKKIVTGQFTKGTKVKVQVKNGNIDFISSK